MAGRGRASCPRGADSAPDLIEPLLGYRLWRVGLRGQLRCLTSREPWRPGPNHARCYRGAHEAPGRLCNCGFNALHEPPPLELADGYRNVVLGAIAAWGEVEVHRDGFRAQRARVIALALGGAAHVAPGRRLGRAALRYDVELVEPGELEQWARHLATAAGGEVMPGGPRQRSAA